MAKKEKNTNEPDLTNESTENLNNSNNADDTDLEASLTGSETESRTKRIEIKAKQFSGNSALGMIRLPDSIFKKTGNLALSWLDPVIECVVTESEFKELNQAYFLVREV